VTKPGFSFLFILCWAYSISVLLWSMFVYCCIRFSFSFFTIKPTDWLGRTRLH